MTMIHLLFVVLLYHLFDHFMMLCMIMIAVIYYYQIYTC